MIAMFNDIQALDVVWATTRNVGVALALVAVVVIVGYFGWILIRLQQGKPAATHFKRMTPLIFAVLVPTLAVAAFMEAIEWRIKSLMQHRLLDSIASDCASCVVRIGGVPAKRPRELCEALRCIQSISPHRSGRTDAFLVSITPPGREKIVLELYRDSGNRDEYWVYWPIIKNWKDIEMGRIRGLDRKLLECDVNAEAE